ncbi:hypothetical protein L1887_14282 [Cichorium endivia]|nr:hypothetical protein L1887_14282 [Cichorium endivia]
MGEDERNYRSNDAKNLKSVVWGEETTTREESKIINRDDVEQIWQIRAPYATYEASGKMVKQASKQEEGENGVDAIGGAGESALS